MPLHEHTALEQTYLIQGSLENHEGKCGPGQLVWRPGGNQHEAVAPNGAYASGGAVATRLLQVGVLIKDTHRNTIRFAPPLIIDESQVDWAADRLVEVLQKVCLSIDNCTVHSMSNLTPWASGSSRPKLTVLLTRRI